MRYRMSLRHADPLAATRGHSTHSRLERGTRHKDQGSLYSLQRAREWEEMLGCSLTAPHAPGKEGVPLDSSKECTVKGRGGWTFHRNQLN